MILHCSCHCRGLLTNATHKSRSGLPQTFLLNKKNICFNLFETKTALIANVRLKTYMVIKKQNKEIYKKTKINKTKKNWTKWNKQPSPYTSRNVFKWVPYSKCQYLYDDESEACIVDLFKHGLWRYLDTFNFFSPRIVHFKILYYRVLNQRIKHFSKPFSHKSCTLNLVRMSVVSFSLFLHFLIWNVHVFQAM